MGLPILVSNPPHRYRRRRRRKAKARRRVLRRNPPKKAKARRRRRRRAPLVFVTRKATNMRRRRRSRGSRRRRGSRALGQSARGFVSADMLKTAAVSGIGFIAAKALVSKLPFPDQLKNGKGRIAASAIIALAGAYALRKAGMRSMATAFAAGGLTAVMVDLFGAATSKPLAGLENLGFVDGTNSYPMLSGVSEIQALAGLGCGDYMPDEAVVEV